MPVQINEMIIRANILEGAHKEAEVKNDGSGNLNKDEIIKECTEIIMEMINKKNER
jgi:phenylpyruvate tautomerase PptA (4-oxalocrotonate tautomerase family)